MGETKQERVNFDSAVTRLSDRLFFGSATGAAMLAFAIVGLILFFLGLRAWPTLQAEGLSFITGSTWDSSVGTFQIMPMLVGSIVVSALGILIATPLSIFAAFFIAFIAPPKLAKISTLIVDLLAALPSILIGFWGASVFTPAGSSWAELLNSKLGFIPLFQNESGTFTRSPFIAGWILAIMMVPIITSVSREVMSRVDKELINAGHALGGTTFSTLRRVILPTSKGGILGGILLALGRGIGETIAILYTLNLVFNVNVTRPLENRGGSVASMIAAFFGEADDATIHALMAAGLVLFVMTLLVNVIATSIVQRSERRMAS